MKTILRNVRGQFGKEEILLDWNEVAEKYGRSCFLEYMTIHSKLLSNYVEPMECNYPSLPIFGWSKRQKEIYTLL